MAIRTSDEYRSGLLDGRRVHFQGRRVESVLADPVLRKCVEHSAIAFDIAEDPQLRELAVEVEDGERFSAFYRLPRCARDLERRAELIEATAARGGTVIVLKEVGSDALFGLMRTLDGAGYEHARELYERCRREDLAVAVAQTDVKGDRSLAPHQQADPDLYLRVVDEDADSITVRGAKCHTSFSINADELIVLPTRAMSTADRDYAVAFAVPIDTEGLELYASPYGSAPLEGDFEFPVSSKHKLPETLTVFNDVVVPKERVFVLREPEKAGPLALGFVGYHRFTAINYKLPLLDAFVGSAMLAAEMNGIARAGHVRDKIAQLVSYAETVRGLGALAVLRSVPDERGIQCPDPLAVNMAKYTFANGYAQAVAHVIDIAGGLLVTGPGERDWGDRATRAVLEKYYAAAAPAEPRLRLLHLIADLTARDFGGYQAVLAAHAEGSLEAEKLQILRSYDSARAKRYVRSLANLSPSPDD